MPKALNNVLHGGKRWPDKSVMQAIRDAACHKRSGPHISRTTLGVPSLTPWKRRPSTLLLALPDREPSLPACACLLWQRSGALGRWRRPVSCYFNDQKFGLKLDTRTWQGRFAFYLFVWYGADDSGTGACCICRLLWNDIVGKVWEASSYRWQALHKTVLCMLCKDTALCFKCHGRKKRVLPHSFNPTNMVGRLV